jgi:hypothetical protein
MPTVTISGGLVFAFLGVTPLFDGLNLINRHWSIVAYHGYRRLPHGSTFLAIYMLPFVRGSRIPHI